MIRHLHTLAMWFCGATMHWERSRITFRFQNLSSKTR